jgi:putative membrane protein
MGAMMGGTGMMLPWVLLWIFMSLALVATAGVVAARVLGSRRGTGQPQIRADEPPAIQEAKDALRRRYASGEISREDYLQGKIELDD